jgi:predicted peptidase
METAGRNSQESDTLNPGAALAVLALCASPLTVGTVAATEASGRFERRTVRVGETVHAYSVWLPPGHETRAIWPAILFLHGAGESGTDAEAPTRAGLGPRLRAEPERWPFVVVFPQKPAGEEEWEEREAMTFAVLDDAIRACRIDSARVALTGMSQGGHGAWVYGARHARRWTCVAPVCGYGRTRSVARRIAALPVWTFHGLRDDVVLPHDTRSIIAAIRAERTRQGLDPEAARMTLYPEANHNAWDPAYAEPGLAEWFQRHSE